MKSAIKYTIFSLLIIVVIGSFYALWSKDRDEDFLVKYEEYVPQDATFVAMGNINEEGTLKKIIDQFMQESVNFGIFSYIDGPGILCSNLTANGFKEDTYLVFIQKVNDSQRLGEACEVIKKYFAKDNLEYAEEDFLKLKINAPKDGQRGFSWAVGKDLLVMASSSKDIKMIFTPSKDWKSIKDLQIYKDAKAKIADCNKGFMFWRIPETFGNLLELGNLDNLKKCKYMISGLKKESSTKWRSLTYLECDPTVLKSILSGEGNINFSSLKYHPHANSCCLGFNAKTALNIFKSAMSNVAEAKQEGSSLKISYNPIEKYMDIISQYVTGEVVLSVDGLGKYQGKNFFNKESKFQDFLAAASVSPWMITVGLNKDGKEIVNGFLDDEPSLKENLNALVTDDYLILMGEALSPKEYREKILANKVDKNWLQALKFVQPPRGIVFICEDCKRNRADTATELRKLEDDKAQFAAEIFAKFSEIFRDSSLLVDVQEDGVRVQLTVETASLMDSLAL